MFEPLHAQFQAFYEYIETKMTNSDISYGGGERCAQGSGGKPEGKRPFWRPRRRWEVNIKMDLQEVGGGCGDWVELAQDRDRWRALVSTVMNLRVPSNAGNFLTSGRTS